VQTVLARPCNWISLQISYQHLNTGRFRIQSWISGFSWKKWKRLSPLDPCPQFQLGYNDEGWTVLTCLGQYMVSTSLWSQHACLCRRKKASCQHSMHTASFQQYTNILLCT
jgi:hypothetical protein